MRLFLIETCPVVCVFTNHISRLCWCFHQQLFVCPALAPFPAPRSFSRLCWCFHQQIFVCPALAPFPAPRSFSCPRRCVLKGTLRIVMICPWWCYRQKENVILPISYAKNLFGDSPTSAPFSYGSRFVISVPPHSTTVKPFRVLCSGLKSCSGIDWA